MDIKKIDSVTLPVTDLQRSVNRYSQTLGLEEIWRQEENKGVGLGIGDNSATLNLFQEAGGPRLILGDRQVRRIP